jgi:NTE family protein
MRRIVLLLLVLHMCAGAALAQTESARPRVGLALAGGSARGFVHVGVLKWLEEHRVPVDVVAGTSMGGLVGGLYAAGYEPKEMNEFFKQIDWDRTFSPIPYNQLPLRRKEDRRDFAAKFEIGLRGRHAGLPGAVYQGHEIGLMLSHFAAPYSRMKSFDDMPTPFRCVATDLIKGQPFVLQSGDLVDALRATMAAPGIFEPVRLRAGDPQSGRIMMLVDGGMFQNLPVDVTRSMGASVVVAVSVRLPEPKPDDLDSLLDVAGRAIEVIVDANERDSLQRADIKIEIDVGKLRATDFAHREEFIALGYQAAEQHAEELLRYALSDADYQRFLQQRHSKRRPENFTPQFVQLAGAAKYGKELERNLSKIKNLPLNFHDTSKSLTFLVGDGRYASADYRWTERDGSTGLLVQLKEKRHGPPFLYSVLNLEGSQTTNVRLVLGARIVFPDLGGPYSEWRTDLLGGSTSRFATEYYWRIGGRRAFISPRGFAEFTHTGIYSGRSRIAEYAVNQQGFGVDLGYAAGRRHEFRFGYEFLRLQTKVSTGTPTLPRFEGFFEALRAQWLYDNMDSALIPRRGLRTSLSMRWVFSAPVVPEPYPILESRIQHAFTFGRSPYSVISALEGGTTAGRDSAIEPFTLGGPLHINALALEQLRGNNYYYGGFYFLRSFKRQPISFLGPNYLTFAYEVGSAFRNVRQSNAFHSGTFGFMSESPIGGVFVGVSMGEGGERKVFFRLGHLF